MQGFLLSQSIRAPLSLVSTGSDWGCLTWGRGRDSTDFALGAPSVLFWGERL